MKVIITNSPQETEMLGYEIGQLVKDETRVVFLLDGQLGSGKTTFSKGLARGIGVESIVNSPTYTIMKKYKVKDQTLYHLDLYRLNGIGDDFDLEEYIDDTGIIIIEWPFKVEELLPNDYVLIKIEKHDNSKREFVITLHGTISESVVSNI